MTSTNTDTEQDEVLAPQEGATGEAADGDDLQVKEKLTLEVQVNQTGACQRHVTVTVSRADIDRYYDEAYSELMPKAHVPGFRPGRAPRKLVESRFRDEITDQIKGSLLLDSMTQVTEEQEFSAISEPDFDFEAVEVPREGPLKFEFDLEVRPEFDLPAWKGLKLERPVRKITKEDVQEHLAKLLRQHGVLTPVDEAAADDYVVVDIRFYRGQKPVSEARDQFVGVRPTLSFPDANLDGFDKLMIGARANDKRTATITVSDDAPNEELRGQEVEATFEILEVKRMTLPELDKEFLSRIGQFENEGELLDAAEGDLKRQMTYHQQQRVRQQISALLTESANWELPPEMLKRQGHRELERAIMELRSSGFSEEEIRAQENLLRQNSLRSTAKALKEHFILEKIAEEEKIDADPSDFDGEIALIAAQSNESPRSVRARIEKRGLTDTLRNQIIERKVINLITSAATFKEVPFNPERPQTTAIQHFIGGQQETEIPKAKHGGDVKELAEPADHT
jgi:trigger factor